MYPKAARANFSHALEAKVKKIIRKALLVGGLETAAPCVGASRPHSPLTAHRYAMGAAAELAEALVAG